MARRAEHIASALQIGERWREDVRGARGPIIVETNETEVAFVLPMEGESVRYIQTSNAVVRVRSTEPGSMRSLSNLVHASWYRDERAGVISWRWELELKTVREIARVRPAFTFQAVRSPEK
jgi:hypothetical protein